MKKEMEYFVIIDYILNGGWEAELRAGMDLVEEYGARGWEIEKESGRRVF